MADITRLDKILLINLGGIGDVLLCLPSLRLLRNSYPQAKIVFVTSARARDILEKYTYVDQVISFEVSLFKKISILFKLRKVKFDLIVNLRPLTSTLSSAKMMFLFFIVKARHKMGRDTQGRGFFLDIKIPESDRAQMHDLDYYFEMFKSLGLESQERDIYFEINEQDRIFINYFLQQQGVSKKDLLIGLNPSGIPSRRWPLENFKKLSQSLFAERELKIVITGCKSDMDLASRLAGISTDRIINAAGKTTTGQLAALISRCSVYVSNDTGTMHMAAALHTPLVALFGPGDTIRYDPRRLSDKVIVLYNKVLCAPCVKINCNSMKCFASIGPEDVLKSALKLL